MITCDLRGGLGNQLFQIFTTIAYSLQSRNPVKFANIETMGGGGCTLRYTYWNTFFSRLQPFLINTREFPLMEYIKENGFHYTPISISSIMNKNVCLYGYYQSYKYFNECFLSICKMIRLEEMKQALLHKLPYDKHFLNNAITLHFRLGDYKKAQHFHPLMNDKYYEDSLHYIEERTITEKNVFYFCEEEDIEQVSQTIDILKSKFPKYQFIRADNELADWEQMLFMSCCRYNVIANSSFSWWGAYFNNDPKQMVIYPSIWFVETAGINVNDLFPSEWIKMEVKL
jgi:hypothetical protein